MASAGRILILPKGNYNAEIEYEMLDLVFYDGASWLAKKTIVGITPSEASNDYWMKMCDSADLTEVYNRLQALESQMLSTISLDDIDLEAYALKTELTNYATKSDLYTVNLNLTGLDGRLDTAEPKLTNLTTDVSNLKTSVSALTSSLSGMSGVKFYTGTLGDNGTNTTRTIPCNFPPKIICVIGRASAGAYTSFTVIIPDMKSGTTVNFAGSVSMGALTATRSGNDVIIDHSFYPDMRPYYCCYSANMGYTYICIG